MDEIGLRAFNDGADAISQGSVSSQKRQSVICRHSHKSHALLELSAFIGRLPRSQPDNENVESTKCERRNETPDSDLGPPMGAAPTVG